MTTRGIHVNRLIELMQKSVEFSEASFNFMPK